MQTKTTWTFPSLVFHEKILKKKNIPKCPHKLNRIYIKQTKTNGGSHPLHLVVLSIYFRI